MDIFEAMIQIDVRCESVEWDRIGAEMIRT